MSAPSEASTSASEVSAKELDAIARKKAKDLRYYYMKYPCPYYSKRRTGILRVPAARRGCDPCGVAHGSWISYSAMEISFDVSFIKRGATEYVKYIDSETS